MADFVSAEKRSRIMSAIRSAGNQTTELSLVAKLRHSRLSGWRRHFSLPGSPDFVWPERSVAVFVDGCFWHGCPRHYKAPTSNSAFWAAKVAGNRRRDQRVAKRLRRAGWSVYRIWECRVGEHWTLERLRRALEE